MLYQIWSGSLLALDRQRELIFTNVIALAGLAVFAAVLIPPFGAQGGAVASVLGDALLAALIYWRLHRRVGPVMVQAAFLGRVVLAGAAGAAVLVPPRAARSPRRRAVGRRLPRRRPADRDGARPRSIRRFARGGEGQRRRPLRRPSAAPIAPVESLARMPIASTHLSTASNQRIEVIALAVVVCALIFELVRRRRLMERYAILWLLAGATVLVLGLWKGLLTKLSHAVGIYYPPSALFAVAFVFVLAMLVHFSTTISRLSDQNKVLAQRVALLEHERRSGEPVKAPEPPR